MNAIVNAIPFVIKKIEFGTSLSAAQQEIQLLVEYSFCGKDHSIHFGFDFNNAGQVLIEFCKEIASQCLGLKKSSSRGSRGIDDAMEVDYGEDENLSVEDLQAIEDQMRQVEMLAAAEMEEENIKYFHAQTELKKELLGAQVASAKIRCVSKSILLKNEYTLHQYFTLIAALKTKFSFAPGY